LTTSTAPTLQIITVSVTAAQLGVPYSLQLSASGGVTPYTWSLAAGSTLPTGLTLSPAGVISGTPTTSGSFTFTATVTDLAGN
jgi:Flp pilus assembly secretin CpaC